MKTPASLGEESCNDRKNWQVEGNKKVPGSLNYRFPQTEKLKGRNEIREVFGKRKGVSCIGAKLFMLQNGLAHNRIAFTFSRKFGTAVERNHSRRLSREVYRLLRNELKKGYDLVLLVNPGRDIFSVRMEQMRNLFSRSGLFLSSFNQESS